MIESSSALLFISVTVLTIIFVFLQILLDVDVIRKYSRSKNRRSSKSKSGQHLDKSINSALVVHELVLLGLIAKIKSGSDSYGIRRITLSDLLRNLSGKIELWLHSWLNAIAFIGLVFVLAGLFWVLRPTDRAVLTMYITAFYVFSILLAQTRLKRFTLMDNINLLLIAPLGLLMNLALVVYTFALVLTKAVYRLVKILSLLGNGANYNH